MKCKDEGSRGAVSWPIAGRLPIDLVHQPVEAVEIITQAKFDIIAGMTNDTDQALVAGSKNGFQQFEVMLAGSQVENLRFSIVHPVDIQAKQIGFHGIERLGKVREVFVTMMKIIDDTDMIGMVLLLQDLANRHHVLGFSGPTPMIVDAQLALHLCCPFDQRKEVLYGLVEFFNVCFPGRLGDHDPDLGMKIIFGKKFKRLVVDTPEGGIFDPLFLALTNLLLEAGDMLIALVISKSLQPQFF